MPATILVVDDEPDLQELVRQKFRRQIRNGELAFRFAGDGEEALSVIQEAAELDLVLSDINMPRMDGLTLLGHLQDIDRQLRTVIVSAYGDMANIRTAMNRGAFDFVTKPIDFNDLEVTIKKTLDDLNTLREAYRLREAAERAKANLARYFSPNLATELAENPDFMKLGGERRELSFLFTDLADFTPLVETLEPAAIVPLLNDYLDHMAQIVFQHGGTVNKIVGDAVHAFFGAPLDQPDHAERAVACAMAVDTFAQSFRDAQNAAGIPLGVTRIGVHSGPAMVGNFGGEYFFEYTAHGNAINTVARLEGANKYLGTRICISANVIEQVYMFKGRPIGTIVLKGMTEAIQVYEPLTAEQADSPATQAYREAFARLEAGNPTAKQTFAAVVAQYGEDPLAIFHLKRLLAGKHSTRIVLPGK